MHHCCSAIQNGAFESTPTIHRKATTITSPFGLVRVRADEMSERREMRVVAAYLFSDRSRTVWVEDRQQICGDLGRHAWTDGIEQPETFIYCVP
jgi:hypothetical protein